jgi:peptidoglycan/xylan/chitin deacetylase (PgdA/CDA1 family)
LDGVALRGIADLMSREKHWIVGLCGISTLLFAWSLLSAQAPFALPGEPLEWGVLWAAALALLLLAPVLRPGTQILGPVWVRGKPDSRAVALTFDDGPDPLSTPHILAALREAGASATFFVLLDRARAHPELLKDIARDQEVALHGAEHDPFLAFRGHKRIQRMLLDSRAWLQERTGQEIRWFRPPFGVYPLPVARAVWGTPLELAWCSRRTLDGTFSGADRLRRICRQAGPGEILLLHEGPRAAVEALPGILVDLKERGLRCATVGEILGP